MKNLPKQIKEKLWTRFSDTSDFQAIGGYVSKPEENLLPGLEITDFEEDLQQGSGNELQSKFLAVHSSSALVVNTFAKWKNKSRSLQLCGISEFNHLAFEKKCPTGLGGSPPNLDLLAESKSSVVGVESKFLEYLNPKRPKFSASYVKDKLPLMEEEWWRLLESYRNGESQYLDVAQLIKHYLGLRNQNDYQDRDTILLYLFWEPLNWQEFDVFVKHREEINKFSASVQNTSVQFEAQSYPELWSQWEGQTGITDHLTNLRRRYLIKI